MGLLPRFRRPYTCQAQVIQSTSEAEQGLLALMKKLIAQTMTV